MKNLGKPPTGNGASNPSQQGIPTANYKSRSRHPPAKKDWDDGAGIM